MATTTEGAALTEAHRTAQVRLSGEALKDFLTVWRLLDPEALDSSFPGYARAAAVVMAHHRDRSAALSSAYLSAFVEAEGSKPLSIARAAELAREQAMTSLLVTGPVAVRIGLRGGHSLQTATQNALVQAAGAVKRHVLNGGRETIVGTAARHELRLARVTDGSPCHFCAMLAGRGAVYLSEDSANVKPHDACGCSAEIALGDDYELPGRAQEFADLWASSTKGLSGAAARAAFRRAYAGL